MSENKKTLIRYLSATICALIIAVAIAYFRGAFTSGSSKILCMGIGDGLFVTGVLYTGIGLLIRISKTGLFDIFGYGFRSLKYLFTPTKKSRDEGGYYEYTVKQKEKRHAAPMYIVWIGIVLMLISTVFVALS